jgi:hypothetical protein
MATAKYFHFFRRTWKVFECFMTNLKASKTNNSQEGRTGSAWKRGRGDEEGVGPNNVYTCE